MSSFHDLRNLEVVSYMIYFEEILNLKISLSDTWQVGC